jgi:hypothetical protein
VSRRERSRTFEHPRYELAPTGVAYDGEQDVRAYFAESRAAFHDQRNELIALHHADDAVIVEFDLLGTHLGRLRALPPTGCSFGHDRPHAPEEPHRARGLRARGRAGTGSGPARFRVPVQLTQALTPGV